MVTETKPTVYRQAPLMTQSKAMYLLRTCYPQAPDVEVVKAGIICATYGINPLLKQISIIKFEGKKGVQWVTVLGIKATRNIALGTGHRWGYIDGPRVMTNDEQMTIFGQTYPDRIVAITKIKDDKGNIYPGYGFYPRNGSVQGEDKGNSVANMAFIRSERNALDKMAPGQLPDTEVVDENFTQVEGNFKEIVQQGKTEATTEAENDIVELWSDGQEAQQVQPVKTLPATLQALMEYVVKHGKSYTTSWVCTQLNVRTLNEIKDFTGAYNTLRALSAWED